MQGWKILSHHVDRSQKQTYISEIVTVDQMKPTNNCNACNLNTFVIKIVSSC